ncbi:hypothetical protein GQS_07210 [Thermococcus sp. 4557]|nr:hypothetical protein GQS_07210 [Thermococcus sp. 4557]
MNSFHFRKVFIQRHIILKWRYRQTRRYLLGRLMQYVTFYFIILNIGLFYEVGSHA